MARRKNVKRIDPRYFLHETVNRLDEREGETAEDVAGRLKNMPASFRASAVNDFLNMRDGSREMARHYPHVQDLVAFASDVLELLGDEVLEEEEAVAEEVDWRKIPAPDPSKRQAAQDRYDKRQRDDTARRRQRVKADIAADKWKNRSRLRNQELGEID